MDCLTRQSGPDNRYQDGDYDGPPSAFDSDTVDNRSLLLDPTTSEYSGDYVPSNDTLDELKDLPTTSLMIDLRRPVEFTILPKRSRFVATQRSAVQVTPLTQPEMMLIGKLVCTLIHFSMPLIILARIATRTEFLLRFRL